jgi:hypothetical protein
MPRKPKTGNETPSRARRDANAADAAEIAAEPSSAPSGTAVAAEAMRTGVVPLSASQGTRVDPTSRGDARLKGGDDDNDAEQNASVGEEAPGGSQLTPDHDRVDDIGRALGVQEADSGELRTSGELLDERDRHRAQQDRPDRTTRD